MEALVQVTQRVMVAVYNWLQLKGTIYFSRCVCDRSNEQS